MPLFLPFRQQNWSCTCVAAAIIPTLSSMDEPPAQNFHIHPCSADARAQMGDQHGLLCKWRRLLSLLILGGARLRSHRACGHLCPRVPPHSRGPDVWAAAAAEKNCKASSLLQSFLCTTAQHIPAALRNCKAAELPASEEPCLQILLCL